MNKIIIAMDGYSGTGKSSTAREVAKLLGYMYIDSGAMYRATTLHFLNSDIDLNDDQQVREALDRLKITFEADKVIMNRRDVSDEIRSMKVNRWVSAVSAIPIVREEMVRQQQALGKVRGIVMDGRDIGTVVFPDAELKVFMTADPSIRAKRRQKELQEKGIFEELNDIKNNLIERDKQDTSRVESPLRKAEDAIEIDTSDLDFDEQVQKVIQLSKQRIYEN